MGQDTFTTLQRTVDSILRSKGTDLLSFLADARTQGWTLEKTSQQLFRLTEGDVSVTFGTLREWRKALLEDVAS